jgi:hypothetical protein
MRIRLLFFCLLEVWRAARSSRLNLCDSRHKDSIGTNGFL